MSMSHTETAAAQPRGNPGEILRLAREERGWKLAEVATQLNLTSHSLSQLEAGEFERLPGHTFARGYVRAYAKLLGLDQAALVEAFDRYTGTNAAGSNVQSLGRLPEPMRLSRTLLRGVSAVLLLLLLLLGYFWWQERPERLADLGAFGLKHIEVDSADGTTQIHPVEEPVELEDQAVAEAGRSAGEAAAETPEAAAGTATASEPATEAAGSTAPASPAPESVAPAAGVSAPSSAETAAPAAADALPVAAPDSTPASTEPPAAVPAAASGSARLEMSFTADCWVQVTDADGRVLLSTVKRSGEALQIDGKAPLELRLGNARGAREVRFNGTPVAHLDNMTASGTARLNLGQ